MAQVTEWTGQEDMAFDYADAYERIGFSCRVFYRHNEVVLETRPRLPEPFAICLAVPMFGAPKETC